MTVHDVYRQKKDSRSITPLLDCAKAGDADKDLVDFALSIHFTELFDHIRDFIRVSCGFECPQIEFGRTDVHITFVSEDIAGQTGPFAAILEYCNIHSFSNSVFRDKTTGGMRYWVSVDIQYKHKDGGSNGMEICRASYRSGEWTFVDAGQTR